MKRIEMMILFPSTPETYLSELKSGNTFALTRWHRGVPVLVVSLREEK
jgi:hypothetical protein